MLLHPKLDRLDRVGRIHRIVLRLVGLDESRKDVEAVAFGRPGLCAPELFHLCKRMVVVPLTSNRLQVLHKLRSSRQCGHFPEEDGGTGAFHSLNATTVPFPAIRFTYQTSAVTNTPLRVIASAW